ncbi:TolC family outer membrane protein [Roseospira marina]|uniref:TolC family outer membrane protein n=1 Tax=Roseospira marina TaxID=140057 RepID=A0A5M6IGG6_9PROT|nr:TolC family outer membrane protein [Roseospira marina]KAA5606977.1 TolC family outer membrane protein [Roseospira marina]MBB4312844.1 outer membrane protein [Roseospira marina]MBB5086383.1 outer membrane protein [Roseospira marina]
MKRLSLLASAAAVASVVCFASWTDARAQSLEEALASAYLNNPSLQARRAQLRAVDQGVPLAKSGWRPSVQVSGETGWQQTTRDLGTSRFDTTNTNPSSVTLSVTQPIFSGFRTFAQVDQAENNVLAERANLTSVEQQVLLDTAVAYLNVVRDHAVVDLNRNNEDVLGRQLEATQDRFRVGEITRTDVAQAEARLSGAHADTADAMASLEISRANFLRVTGVMPGELDPPPVVPNLPVTLDNAIERALVSNPNVIAAEYSWKAAQDEIRNQRGLLLPEVSLQGTYLYGWDQGNIENSEQETLAASINVTVPIYQGGGVYAQLRQAKHSAGQARLQLDDARTDVRERTQQAWEQMTATTASIESLEDQIDAAEIALEGVRREAQVGARTVLDVLDAEQELLNARVNLVRAQRDELVAGFNLLASVGGMTAADLNLPVSLYDPIENYENVRDQWFGGTDAADADAALGTED